MKKESGGRLKKKHAMAQPTDGSHERENKGDYRCREDDSNQSLFDSERRGSIK